jgi:GNAT superfamily N-acetyltransferase
MNCIVRQATEDDFSKIHQLNREFAHFIKTPEKFRISVQQMIDEQEHFRMIVAENEEMQIVGFATTYFAWYSWIGKSLYLDDIYIKEDYRGLGLGTKMMNEIFSLAKKENCKKIRWQVSNWNKKAIEFYKKKGAVIDGTEWNCDVLLNEK